MVKFPLGPLKLEVDVPAFDIAEVLEALTHELKCCPRVRPQHPNPRSLIDPLRPPNERPDHSRTAASFDPSWGTGRCREDISSRVRLLHRNEEARTRTGLGQDPPRVQAPKTINRCPHLLRSRA